MLFWILWPFKEGLKDKGEGGSKGAILFITKESSVHCRSWIQQTFQLVSAFALRITLVTWVGLGIGLPVLSWDIPRDFANGVDSEEAHHLEAGNPSLEKKMALTNGRGERSDLSLPQSTRGPWLAVKADSACLLRTGGSHLPCMENSEDKKCNPPNAE